MKTLKRNRLRQLVSWGYITQPQANQMWRDYLRLFKRVTNQNQESEDMRMDNEEMTNIIYDTLMNNKQHCQLDLDRLDNQEVSAKNGIILFDYEDVAFRMSITVDK